MKIGEIEVNILTGVITESALPMGDSHDAMRGHLRKAISDHLGAGDSWENAPYVHDVFPKHVVYSHKGQTYKAGYTAEQGSAGTNPKVTLGKDHKKVHVAYMDNADQKKEAASVMLTSDSGAITATEKGIVYGGGVEKVIESASFDLPETFKESKGALTIPVKVIGPGQGSMAFYSEAVLKKAAIDGVFKAGTHMMWNHQTATEEADRPEGNLHNLAAVLVENAKWQDKGPKGPGLYAKAKVFSDYAQAVSEKGPHIGVSINAAVRAHEGVIDGKKVRIADEFVYAYSTDFVTKAGAGGAPVVPVTESANPAHIIKTEVETMEVDVKVLEALQTSVTKLTEGQTKLQERADASDKEKERLAAENAKMKLQNQAREAVTAALQEAGIPVGARLLSAVCAEPVVKEGAIDKAWVDGVVADFAESHGATGGRVLGMGGHSKEDLEPAKVTERATNAFGRLGVGEDGMKFALEGGVR